MAVFRWYLPTLSEVLRLDQQAQGQQFGSLAQQRIRAERQWCGAIAALNQLLQQTVAPFKSDSATVDHGTSAKPISGLVLSGPLPVLDQPDLIGELAAWTFTADPLAPNAWMPLQLLPASGNPPPRHQPALSTLPLLPDDPLATEQFCLILTADFSLVLVLGETTAAEPVFQFSFAPDVVERAWLALRSRLLFANTPLLDQLDAMVEQFPPIAPAYETVMQFSQLILAYLPEPIEWETPRDSLDRSHCKSATKAPPLSVQLGSAIADASSCLSSSSLAETQPQLDVTGTVSLPTPQAGYGAAHASSLDTELLQAIAHEVRTPLTTIRTLTRLLLKRKELSPDILKRLKMIDQECTEQIDRFSLIFRAVELETSAVKTPAMPLAATSLAQVFQNNVPRWQQQASDRNLTLDVILPQKLPMVVTDPTMLDQVLTGLIDRITHSLPPGSRIQVHVMLAGHQLKLQFQSQVDGCSGQAGDGLTGFTPTLKSIGQLLMFQPETGNLSLNLSATKNLFQALGGKMIVRQRPKQGEVLTIFLPLETRRLEE